MADKNIIFYDSVTDFVKACPEPGAELSRLSGRTDWSGNQSYQEAYKNIFAGMPDAVKRSDALLDKLESDGLELAQTTWDTELVGYFPNVPSFVNGDPESMFTPIEVQSDTSPMRVFASVCLSAGFGADDLEKRGVAILALVRRLSLIRPVELYLYSDQEGRQPCVKLETMPLDLTLASYALANAAFLRRLCFAWGYDGRGFNGEWAKWGGNTDIGYVREALGANPQDLVITGSYLTRDNLTDPLIWINEHLKKYGNTLESLE